MTRKTLAMRPYKAVMGTLLVLALVVGACGERIVDSEAVTKEGHYGACSRKAYEEALQFQCDDKKDDLTAMYLMEIVFDLPAGQRVLVLQQTANGLVELKALDYPYEGEIWWASEKAIEIKKGG